MKGPIQKITCAIFRLTLENYKMVLSRCRSTKNNLYTINNNKSYGGGQPSKYYLKDTCCLILKIHSRVGSNPYNIIKQIFNMMVARPRTNQFNNLVNFRDF